MREFSPLYGLGTIVTHFAEGHNPHHAHVTPIYQTSTFSFPDVATGMAVYKGEQPGYIYSRISNPNPDQFALKIAFLEALELLGQQPELRPEQVVAGKAFASGMAAISAGILARVQTGDTIVAQEALYSNAYNFLSRVAPRLGIQVVWVRDTSAAGWESAFRDHPRAKLAYAETPANPTMMVVDLKMLAEMAHQHECWLMVDNTFATPYCQRPLSLGADVVVHSTTKYLSGHGVLLGGAVASPHLDYVQTELYWMLRTMGATPSPFDSWLANTGLKTFELRMQRHCENAMEVARYLEAHPKVSAVHYPGLPGDPGHAVAGKQMHAFGGMLSFELKGGLEAGISMMEKTRLATLAASLGNVDSLIQHPASMTHGSLASEDRLRMGITDGLVRFSVGIENIEDILADLEQALE